MQAERRGKIHCILGPMFSGKTTELHRKVRRHRLAKNTTLVIKYQGDERNIKTEREYKVSTITHDGYEEAAVECGSRLMVLAKMAMEYHVIGIDEGQFFDDITEFSELLANSGKIVVISALDGDKNRNMWLPIQGLLPKCDSFEKLSAICVTCGKKAPFTFRHGEEVVLIGAKQEGYEAYCRVCYFETSGKTIQSLQ